MSVRDGKLEGIMAIFEGAGRRPILGAKRRDGAGAVLWAVLWLPALGLMLSGIFAAAGFDLGAALLLLE
jgi:hypothetical protein